MQTTALAEQKTNAAYEPWFDDLVATLRGHQVQLEAGVASEATASLYQQLMAGDGQGLMHANRQMTQRFFVSNILVDYYQQLADVALPKLAFYHTDSEVLVWAEIADDDLVAERRLILAEAFVNNTHHKFGFDVTTTIVECRDELPVPNHYRQVI